MKPDTGVIPLLSDPPVKQLLDSDDSDDDSQLRTIKMSAVNFASIQAVLRDLGMPSLKDRTMTPQYQDSNGVTVVLMGDLGACLPIFFEGKINSAFI
jgi:hypothetical protein